jgi:hypothetical protein
MNAVISRIISGNYTGLAYIIPLISLYYLLIRINKAASSSVTIDHKNEKYECSGFLLGIFLMLMFWKKKKD